MDQTSTKAVLSKLFAQGRRKKGTGDRSFRLPRLPGKSMLAALILAGISLTQNALAQSSWPRYRFDAGLSGRAAVNGPTLPELQWTVPIGAEKIESPVVAPDSSIIFTSRGDKFVYALRPDGSLKWKFNHGNEAYSAPPVIGSDGNIYVGTQQRSFLSINLNGNLRWRVAVGGWVSYSANVDGAGNLYLPVDDGLLYVFDANGNLKCQGDYEGEKPGNTPALGANGRVYAPAGNNIHVFDSSCQKIGKWNHPALGEVAWVVLSADGNTLYAGSRLNAAVVALDADSGEEIWVYRYEQQYGPPSPVALGPDGTLHFAGFDRGLLVALTPGGNPKAGWPRDISSGRYKTMPVVDAQGNVYIVNENSNFGLFALSPDNQILWQLPEVQCKYSIALGPNGTLYVPSLQKIYAVGQKPPRIVARPVTVEFGQVCLNDETILTSTLFNEGASDLIISRYELISPVFRFEATETRIRPGDSLEISVSFTPNAVGSFSDSLLVFSNDPNQNPLVIFLRGEGIAPQIAGPASLTFPPTEVGFDTLGTVVIRAAGACTLRVDSVRIAGTNAGDFFVATTGFPIEIVPGDSLRLAAGFRPTAVGERNATLQVFSTDPDTNPLEVALRGTGTTPPPRWRVSPLDLAFAACVDTSDRKYLRVENIGVVNVTINSAQISNSAFVIDTTGFAPPVTLLPGQTLFLPIRFTPVDADSITGTLTVTSSFDAVPASFQVALTGKGSRPEIQLAARPPALEICLGQSAETKIVIFNPSTTCALRVDSFKVAIAFLALTPAQSSSFLSHQASAPIIIAPGDSTVIPIEITQPPDDFELRVTFWSNAGGSPHEIAVPGKVLAPAIAAVDTLVNFGVVAVQQTAQAEAAVRNIGQCDLRIISARITGADSSSFSVDAFSLPFTLLAGDSLALPVTFTPKRTGGHRAVLLVENDDPDSNPVRIELIGEGSQISVFPDPAQLVFSGVCLGSDSTLIVEIVNNGSDTVKAASIGFVLGRPEFSVVPAPNFRVPPGQRGSLTIGFKPTSLERVDDTLRIVWTDSAVDTVLIPVSGQAVSGQIAGPVEHVFPSTPVFQTEIDTIYVRNAGECDLVVDSTVIVKDLAAAVAPVRIAAQDPPFRVIGDFTGEVILPGDSLGIPVEFAPHEVGLFIASLLVYNSDPDSVDNPFRVRLIGEGTPAPPFQPDIAVDSATLNFGAICETANRELVISNEGNATLLVTRLAFSDSAYSTTQTVPFSLQPNEQRIVVVTFNPAAVQSSQDTLFIFSDDPDENPYPVVLLGSKGQPNIAGANLLLFPETSVGDSSERIYTFYNAGICSLRVDSLTITGTHVIDFGIAAPSTAPFSLVAGDSAQVTIRFAPKDSLLRNATLNIFSNDGDENPKVVQLQGNGSAPEIAVVPNPLDFGKVRVGQDSCAFVLIQNRSIDSLSVISVKLRKGLPFSVEIQGGTDLLIVPGEEGAAVVCFEPPAPGLFNDILDVSIARIVNSKVDSTTDSTFSVILKGEGTVAVLYAQSPLDLQAERVGRFIRVTAYDGIRNIGKAPLTISALQQPPSDFTVELPGLLPLRLEPGEARDVHVIFRPSRNGELRSHFVIVSDAFLDTLHVVELQGRGQEEAVCGLSAEPTELNFGDVMISPRRRSAPPLPRRDSTRTIPFKIINKGGANLNWSFAFERGTDFVFDPPRLTLAGKESIEVVLTFKPQTAGPKRDRLVIKSQNFGGCEQIIELTGRGLQRPNSIVLVRPEVFTPNNDTYNDVARFEFFDEIYNEPVIKLFNIRGQLIATLDRLSAEGVIIWDGRDDRGNLVAPHTYLWYLQDGDKVLGNGHVGVVR